MPQADSSNQNVVNDWATRSRIFKPEPSAWYAGLVIDPHEFSAQLSSLQLSLQGANAAAHARGPVSEMAAIHRAA